MGRRRHGWRVATAGWADVAVTSPTTLRLERLVSQLAHRRHGPVTASALSSRSPWVGGARDGTKRGAVGPHRRHPSRRTRGRAARPAAEAGARVAARAARRRRAARDELVDVSGYDWVVLTSVVGAQELKRRMRGVPQRVAAIGHATAEAFGGADVIATTSTQEGLLAVLPSPPGRVLFAGAEGARRHLPEALRRRRRPLPDGRALTARLARLRPRRADVPLGGARLRALGASTPVVSLGPDDEGGLGRGVDRRSRGTDERPRRHRRRRRASARVVDSPSWSSAS